MVTCCFLFLITNLKAQDYTAINYDSLATAKSDSLLLQVDSVLIYHYGCVGCYMLAENGECVSPDSYLLLWPQGDKLNSLRVDECGVVEGSCSSELWSDLTLNAGKIFSSNFECSYVVSHYGFDFLTLRTHGKTEKIRIFDYYFDSDLPDSTSNAEQPAKLFLNRLNGYLSE